MLAADPIAFGLASRAGRSTCTPGRRQAARIVGGGSRHRPPLLKMSTAHRRGPAAAAASKRLWTWIYRHLSDR
jgi:hypothetical protein